MHDSNRGERSEDLGQGLAILWSVVLCCLIVSVLTYSAVKYGPPQSDSAANYEQRASRDKEAICVGRVGGLLAECLAEQDRAAENAYHAHEDLKAQRQMALWAMWMFLASGFTAVLTLWALWFVRGTLIATREALDDTGKATAAMVKANQLASDMSQRQLRAYLSISSVDVESDEQGMATSFKVTFKNGGQTPAYKAVAWAGIGFEIDPPTFNIRDGRRSSRKSEACIGNNDTIGCGISFPKGVVRLRDALTSLRDGAIKSYVTTGIIYKDCFGRRRITKGVYEVFYDSHKGCYKATPTEQGQKAT